MNWTINRAGIVNFWYYDDEEFHFSEGRLLLNGANGSGKSVTMQSLLPLLLDGNKSPERLDPFGSRARKMDNYMLSDNFDGDERTGYLFLEFAKPTEKRYKTIGMGMRARKNKPLDSWYFIVHDNRRLGSHYDLPLYKETGIKTALTKRELENRLADGGTIFTRQKDYKAAVNAQLFGFEDLSDFDELITLLVQLRSPKLSKAFRPTNLYEIMQESLVTLSEDDLRPMSESIENMDEIKLGLDALDAALKALKRVEKHYDIYNKQLLLAKANYYLDAHKQHAAIVKEIATSEALIDEAQDKLHHLTTQIERLTIEKQALQEKELNLREHDLSRLAEEKLSLQNTLNKLNTKYSEKSDAISSLNQDERKLTNQIKNHNIQLEILSETITKQLAEMAQDSIDIGFDEHNFFESDYKAASDGFNFDLHQKQINRYKQRLSEGRRFLEKLKRLSDAYGQQLQICDDATKETQKMQRQFDDQQRLLNEIMDELTEALHAWHSTNTVLIMSNQPLIETSNRIYKYREPYSLDEVFTPIKAAYDKVVSDLHIDGSQITSDLNNCRNNLEKLKADYQSIEELSEPPLPQSESLSKHRTRLQQADIPFVPFYKAVDFKSNVSEDEKAIIEASLIDMGLLNALIVPTKHHATALDLLATESEKIIAIKPHFFEHTLSTFLEPAFQSDEIANSLIADAIASVPLDDIGQAVFLNEKGHYQLALLKGRAAIDGSARYIGYEARHAYKTQLLAEKQKEITAAENLVTTLAHQLTAVQRQISLCNNEWQSKPSAQDLELAQQEKTRAALTLQQSEAQLKKHNQLLEEKHQALRALEKQSENKLQGIYLKRDLATFEYAESQVDQYLKTFNELIRSDQQKRHELEKVTMFENQKIRCLMLLDDALYEQREIEKEQHANQLKLDNLNTQLASEDYIALEKALQTCRNRLSEINHQHNEIINQQAKAYAICETNRQIVELKTNAIASAKERLTLYQNAFRDEAALGYLLSNFDPTPSTLYKQALSVSKDYSNANKENRTVHHYSLMLAECFQQEQGNLVEYNIKRVQRFNKLDFDISDEDRQHIERIDLVRKQMHKEISFKSVIQAVQAEKDEKEYLLREKDRELFEEILLNTVSKKISAKIYHSEKWVKKIDQLMQSMKTSSTLNLNLTWKAKKATVEDQLSTTELVDILRGDQRLLSAVKRQALTQHFRSKISEAKMRLGDENRSFLTLIKEILDYRQWFDFKLYYTKKGERKKELTNHAFDTFSGGEKAMTMYVPLFSAVFAKYSGARDDCPKVLSLDEAFAGVDEDNIADMFRLLVELNLGFIANSQVLFGDYPTIPALSIYQLNRPNNQTFISLIRYLWNGRQRILITESEPDDE